METDREALDQNRIGHVDRTECGDRAIDRWVSDKSGKPALRSVPVAGRPQAPRRARPPGRRSPVSGAVAGAAGGAVVGAIIGSSKDKQEADRKRAIEAASNDPALASAVVQGGTADLNDDGFVTIDEIVAMQEAGLADDEILDRCPRDAAGVSTHPPNRNGRSSTPACISASSHGLRNMNSDMVGVGSPPALVR